jgi:hypothetical protein
VHISLPNIARLSPLVSPFVFSSFECHNLIEHRIVAQRAVMNLVSSADGLITAYDTSFRELRIEFVMGSTLQTALTTVRILEKVDNIGSYFQSFRTIPLILNVGGYQHT